MRNKSFIGSLVALALGAAPAAHSAGLGKLNILSGIGQPLVAEIDLVSVRPDELSTLGARIPAPDAYRNANMSFSPALVGARATIERRPGGAPYVRITSGRPIEEPYIDLLVELTWNTGRLVREYTALVDPPAIAPKQVATPTPVAPESKPMAVAPMAAPARQAAAPGAGAATGSGSYGPVQPGDTLHKIASGVKPEGVSLEQVLVGIFRSNPDAFINNNMNLLRSGRVLRIPDAAELGKVSGAEAGNEVRLQAADWNAYRQRLAGAAPETQPGDARVATGQVSRVEGPGAGEQPGKEVVKVSKGAPGQGAGSADSGLQDRIRVLEEEATAREKMLKEANERIATLENTLKDMQRLLELKGAAVAPPPAATPPAPAATAPSAAVPPSAEAPAAEAPKADVPPPIAEAKPEAAPEVPPAPAPKPQAMPAEPPPPAAATAWWEDPALLGAAVAGLGVLGGIGLLLARRRRTPAEVDTFGTEPTVRAPVPPAPAAAAAVAVADRTAEVAPPAAAVAAAAPADDVDPIQEADVYIAYGRDAQAEEILKEALAKSPGRQEIKLKLLEIYAARRSKNDFNALAADLHETTKGRGELWLKAATMGFALDPDNALYAAGKDSAILPQVGVSTDVNLDFDLDMVTAAGAPTTVTDVPLDSGHEQTVKTMALSPERMEALRAEGAAAARSATDTQPIVPDIDVSAVQPAPQTDVTLAPVRSGPITDINLEVPQSATTSNVIDFEFDPSKTVRIEPEAAAAFAHDQTVIISPENQEQARDLGLEIDLSALDAPAPAKAQEATAPASASPGEISFDFELPPESPATAEMEVPPTDITLDVPEPKTVPAGSPDFALDTVSLDLGSLEKTEVPAAPVHDDHWYDVQTKFDLAKAYQEMGDRDGAREILAEVIKEGDAQQKAEADELMAKLG